MEKLVRDHIPLMMALKGELAKVRRVEGGRLTLFMAQKVLEEALEVLHAVSYWHEATIAPKPGAHYNAMSAKRKVREEMADLSEIVTALMTVFGEEEIELVRLLKSEERGAFNQGIVMEVPQGGLQTICAGTGSLVD